METKKKKLLLPIKVIIIGCLIGVVVAGIGGIKEIAANKTNNERAAEALKASKEAIKAANERLAEIEVEYNNLKNQYNAKVDECDSIVLGSDGWIQASSKCSREKLELSRKISDLETEDMLIRNKDYTGYYQKVKPMSYQIFYIIGASIAVLAIIGAFIIYLVKGKKTYN